MKKYLIATAFMLVPAAAMADHPEGGINDIRSELRDDYRQLNEDREAGFTNAVREDQREIAEDKMRLREATAHPNRPIPPSPRLDDIRPASGDQVYAAPPEDRDELRRDPNYHPDKLNPDIPFNHAARVDNEVR